MKEEHFKFASEKKQRKIVANNVHHANLGGRAVSGRPRSAQLASLGPPWRCHVSRPDFLKSSIDHDRYSERSRE